jgi:hypothetical protein
MEKQKKNDSGCGGECKCNGNPQPQDIRAEYGKAVAGAAIKEMRSKKEESPSNDQSEVVAFIRECEEAEEDVVTVVKHIARREGIDLYGNVPRDLDKARLWSFLIDVLKTLAIELAQAAAKMIISGELSWKDVLHFSDEHNDDECRAAQGLNDVHVGSRHGRGYVICGNGSSVDGYAFTW